MPRRLKISPLQRDIIWTLEEAGAETIGTVIATVKPSDEDDFRASVDELVKLGLVKKEETNLVLTERGRAALPREPFAVHVHDWRNIAISLIGLIFGEQAARPLCFKPGNQSGSRSKLPCC